MQSLSGILLKSCKGQMILLQSLIKLLNTSKDENNKQYLKFIQTIAQQNIKILTSNAKLLLTELMLI